MKAAPWYRDGVLAGIFLLVHTPERKQPLGLASLYKGCTTCQNSCSEGRARGSGSTGSTGSTGSMGSDPGGWARAQRDGAFHTASNKQSDWASALQAPAATWPSFALRRPPPPPRGGRPPSTTARAPPPRGPPAQGDGRWPHLGGVKIRHRRGGRGANLRSAVPLPSPRQASSPLKAVLMREKCISQKPK